MKNRKPLCITALFCTAALLASCGSAGEETSEGTAQAETSVSVTDVSQTEVSETGAVTTVSETVSETEAAVSDTSTSETSTSVSEATASVSETRTAETAAETKNEQGSEGGSSGNENSGQEAATEKPAEPKPEPEPEPESGDAVIELKGDTAESSSSKVSVNGSEVTIKAEGTYKISGTLNGCIVVAAPKDAKVDIELNGVNICNSNGSAVRVDTADKVKIISGSGSDNSLSDGGSSEACIFSREDITLKGDGVIRINGNVKNAVQSKNTLKITGGTLEVSSQNNGLVGKDKVAVEAGQITINCARDALKATNDSEAGKGVVYVTGGSINITAGDDIIQAISEVTVNNCSINAKFEGKKANCPGAVNVDEGCITKIK